MLSPELLRAGQCENDLLDGSVFLQRTKGHTSQDYLTDAKQKPPHKSPA